MSERHQLLVTVHGEDVYLAVRCPFDMADTERPCWPYRTLDVDEPEPEPVPQGICTYTQWIDECGSDLLHGRVEFSTPMTVLWNDLSGPTFFIGTGIDQGQP
jgi:hypothetical protein